jgi:hypothetical protein
MPGMTRPANARRQDDAVLGRPGRPQPPHMLTMQTTPGPGTYPSVTLPRVTRTRVAGLDLRTWRVPHASSALSFALRASR